MDHPTGFVTQFNQASSELTDITNKPLLAQFPDKASALRAMDRVSGLAKKDDTSVPVELAAKTLLEVHRRDVTNDKLKHLMNLGLSDEGNHDRIIQLATECLEEMPRGHDLIRKEMKKANAKDMEAHRREVIEESLRDITDGKKEGFFELDPAYDLTIQHAIDTVQKGMRTLGVSNEEIDAFAVKAKVRHLDYQRHRHAQLPVFSRERVNPEALGDPNEDTATSLKHGLTSVPKPKKTRQEIIEESTEWLRQQIVKAFTEKEAAEKKATEAVKDHEESENNVVDHSGKESLGVPNEAGAPDVNSKNGGAVDDNSKETDAVTKVEKDDEWENLEDNSSADIRAEWILISKKPGRPPLL